MFRGAETFVHFFVGDIIRNSSVMFFKDISYLELWQPSCSVERNHLCYFCLNDIRRNNLFFIWGSASGGDVVYRDFLSRALAGPLFGGVEPFVQLR